MPFPVSLLYFSGEETIILSSFSDLFLPITTLKGIFHHCSQKIYEMWENLGLETEAIGGATNSCRWKVDNICFSQMFEQKQMGFQP